MVHWSHVWLWCERTRVRFPPLMAFFGSYHPSSFWQWTAKLILETYLLSQINLFIYKKSKSLKLGQLRPFCWDKRDLEIFLLNKNAFFISAQMLIKHYSTLFFHFFQQPLCFCAWSGHLLFCNCSEIFFSLFVITLMWKERVSCIFHLKINWLRIINKGYFLIKSLEIKSWVSFLHFI